MSASPARTTAQGTRCPLHAAATSAWQLQSQRDRDAWEKRRAQLESDSQSKLLALLDKFSASVHVWPAEINFSFNKQGQAHVEIEGLVISYVGETLALLNDHKPNVSGGGGYTVDDSWADAWSCFSTLVDLGKLLEERSKATPS